jgi:hypothetical protein
MNFQSLPFICFQWWVVKVDEFSIFTIYLLPAVGGQSGLALAMFLHLDISKTNFRCFTYGYFLYNARDNAIISRLDI